MNKILPFITLSLFPLVTTATPVFHPSGPSLTYGSVSHHQTVFGHIQNPAASAASVATGGRFGMGMGSFGFGLEFGPVDNLIDDLDELSLALDEDYASFSEAEAVIDRFDAALVTMGQDGYAKVSATAHVPLFPLVVAHSSLGGSVVVDANVASQSRLGILDSPLRYNPLTSTLETKTALYLKRAVIGEFSLAYSRAIRDSTRGSLYGGLRLRYLQGDLDKQVVPLTESDDSAEVLSDFASRDLLTNDSAIGVDAGVLWVAPHFRAGATLANANVPRLNYRTIGASCAPADTSCQVAASFSDRIALTESHLMERQLQLEVAAFTGDNHWVLATSLDVNPVRDPVGDEVQWAAASVAYATSSWLMPGYRFGYRANLAGSRMEYLTSGLTLFKTLNFDLAWGLKEVTMDGEKYPRSAMVNLGFELAF